MRKILFIGTGAVAAEFTSYIEDSNWGNVSGLEIKGYLTVNYDGIDEWKSYSFIKPYFGELSDYTVQNDEYFVLAFANPKVKKTVANMITSKGGKMTNLIHPSASISKTAHIGNGNLISPDVIIGPNVILGDLNVLTTQTLVSHDSVIGNSNFFSTTILCGHTTVGDENFFGVRSTVVPSVKIGDRNTIQAGMVVDKNIGDNTTVFYRYKERIIAVQK